MRRIVKFISFDGWEFDNEESCFEHETKIINNFLMIKASVVFYDEEFQPIPFCETKITEENYSNLVPDFTYLRIEGPQDDIIKLLNKYYKTTDNYIKIIGKSKYGFYVCSKIECVPADDFVEFIKKNTIENN